MLWLSVEKDWVGGFFNLLVSERLNKQLVSLWQEQEEEGEGESEAPAEQEEEEQQPVESQVSDSHSLLVDADAAAGAALPSDDDDFEDEEEEVSITAKSDVWPQRPMCVQIVPSVDALAVELMTLDENYTIKLTESQW